MEEKLSQLDQRLKNIIASAEDIEKTLYYDEEEIKLQEAEIARIEEGYKALNKKLSATEKNRWGYSPSGWLSKKLVSKHLNSMKNGLFSIFPIPCKGANCPYHASCIALQNNLQPPIGEPCVIEVMKIEQAVVSYADEYDINSSSNTDRTLIQELIQLELLMDRCQNLMAQEASPLQEITMGITEDGTTYTQPVVSRYFDAWERMSKRRQSLLNEMMSTRKAKKGIKTPNESDEDLLLKMTNQEGFFTVEEKPRE